MKESQIISSNSLNYNYQFSYVKKSLKHIHANNPPKMGELNKISIWKYPQSAF